jgi:hypothetical protein
VVKIEFVGPLLKGRHLRSNLFIMRLAPRMLFYPLEEHLEKQGPSESGFLCLDSSVREDFDFE